jgi:WD40 repeat protein/Tfp pilus assembly protein PilF
VGRTWRWCRRNPLGAAMLATVTGFLIAIALVSFLFSLHLGKALEEKTDQLWQAKLQEGRSLRRSGQVDSRGKALAALQEAARLRVTPELRDEAIACLAVFNLRLTEQWDGKPLGTVNFDASLTHYGQLDQRGAVTIHLAGSGVEVGRLPGSRYQGIPWFSADGRLMAIGAAGGLKVWDLARRKFVLKVNSFRQYNFSPDSRQLAGVHPDGTIGLYDLVTRKRLRVLARKLAYEPAWVAFHPQGHQLALACPTGVQIRDLATGKIALDLHQKGGAHMLEWSADGRLVAAVGSGKEITLWDVPARQPARVFPGDSSGGTVIALSPGGDLLAAHGWSGELCLWDVPTGRSLLRTRRGATYWLRFSKDGRRLAAHVFEGTRLGIWEVQRSRVFRTLTPLEPRRLIRHPTFHPRECLLAASSPAIGVSLWDPVRGAELARVPSEPTDWALFEPSGALLTRGPSGVQRWPCRVQTGGLLRVGPPRALPLARSGLQLACSSDGRVIASAQGDHALVLHADHGAGRHRLLRLGPFADARYIAVSPDGHLIATGTHNDRGVKIWDARTGRLVQKLLSNSPSWQIAFSPDGRWLAAQLGCRLWKVGSWHETIKIGGEAFAFAPDSQLLAVETGQGVIRLVDVPTGRERARLENPNQETAAVLRFSPDGAQLACNLPGNKAIGVWDLRALGEELTALDLPWDGPAMKPAAGRGGTAQPPLVKVTLLPGDQQEDLRRQLKSYTSALAAKPGDAGLLWQRALVHDRLERFSAAVEDLTAAIRIKPHSAYFRSRALSYQGLQEYGRAVSDLRAALRMKMDRQQEAEICNDLAWILVTGPPAVRAPDQALPLAQRAVRLFPQDGHLQNTLGVVYYRLRQYDAAVETLRRSLRDGACPGLNLFVLALCHHKLGEAAKAQDCHDEAMSWWTSHRPTLSKQRNKEMEGFLAEWKALRKSGPR